MTPRLGGDGEEYFEALLESAPDAIIIVDATGRIVLVNRRGEELFGYPAGELLGQPIELLVPERFRRSHVGYRGTYGEDAKVRPMGAGLELYGRRRDGVDFPVEISLSPMRPNGETLVITIVRDVSERKLAELERLELVRAQAARAEAEAAQARLLEILGDLDAVVWEAETTARERFSFVSGRPEHLLGYQPDLWLAPGFWRRIIHAEDRDQVLRFFEQTVRDLDDYEHEYRLLTADGRIVRVRDIVHVSRDASGMVDRLRGLIVDVTDQRELEGQLLQAQKMEAVGQLAGGIAHDFNNLITIISGHARLLLAEETNAASRESLPEIVQAADRAADLTAKLLAFSRRKQQQREVIDLNDLVREIEGMLRRLIDADITLAVTLAPEPQLVDADPGELCQVLMNLVVNARDAVAARPRASIRIETAPLEIGASDATAVGLTHGSYSTLVVTDNGTGMSEETLARAFEPFFTTKEIGKGSGLGLSTVFGIVDQLGGRITVESSPGKGTRFVVALPSLPSTAPAPNDRPLHGPVVLVVEDQTALRSLVRSILERRGVRVLAAPNGREALDLLRQHSGRIDLVITDVVMPEMNGPELVARLRQEQPGMRVLYMTGYADSRLISRGLVEQEVAVIRKPFTPEALASQVEEHLAHVPWA